MNKIFEKDGRICSWDERGVPYSVGTYGLEGLIKADSYQSLIFLLISHLEGKQPATRRTAISRILRPISKAVETSELTQWPESAGEWQGLVREMYRAVLANTDAELETRVFSFDRVLRPFLHLCIRERLIPGGVLIPKMGRVGQAIRGGGIKSDFISEFSRTSQNKADSHLVSLDLARSDVEYLDALQFDTEALLLAIESAAVEHFKLIAAHWSAGKEIIRTTDVNNLIEVHKAKRPVTKRLIAEEIALSKVTNNGVYSRTHKNKLVVVRDKRQRQDVALLNEMTGVVSDHIPNPDRINWMLGNLTVVDVAIAITLLLIKNPKWRPESLLYANLLNRDGAPYLKLNDNGPEFSIFKERAKDKRISNLDPSSLLILETVVGMTQEPRTIQKTPKLFLATAHRRQVKVPHKGMVYRAMGASSRASVLSFLKLKRTCSADGFTFTKIKNSTGLLEFLRTGSVRAVARILGNNETTALNHYIPASIIAIWNTRQVRRMQNLMLVAASGGKSYLLKATDFRRPDDMAKFVGDMIKSAGHTSNPLLMRLRAIYAADQAAEVATGAMLISISVENLTVVYAAHRCIARSRASFGDISESSGDLKGLIILSQLLQERLADHKDPQFRWAHREALKNSEMLTKTLSLDDLDFSIDEALK